MRPYESDIYKPNRELNHGNQTEIVAFDIEYITLLAKRKKRWAFLLPMSAISTLWRKFSLELE